MALRLGVDWARLYAEFQARATCRFYCGEDVREAEAGAWQDITERAA